MQLNVYRADNNSTLIEEYFELSFCENAIPFKTKVIPIALPSITYIKKGEHLITTKNDKFNLEGLVLSGQAIKAFEFEVKTASYCIGLNLHPSALYKIFNRNISELENGHVSLCNYSKNTALFLQNILNDSKCSGDKMIVKIEEQLKSLPLKIDDHTKNMDAAIDLIRGKDGLLNVSDLLQQIKISQKTLETKFKQIIGTTPGKYIKLYRFIKLMQKLESQQIELKELIFMYDYYDESHFAKDFKSFMGESARTYFGKENEILKKYLS